MVELLLLGHHELAGLRYGDAQVNLCVMLAANLWRAGGAEGATGASNEKAHPACGMGFIVSICSACGYLPQKDRK
ncbi:hypothetical protein [Desulfovibrio sp.]|uniref:hypothetical protein n=1 Tax=Desulfovibrio sp. TaxID=885 RepID=UPI0025BCB631|nr:hypothetical protein [Desulfovibrio sp.]